MAKYARIRITKNDRREHAKLAKNAKAKIKRTLKNHGIDLSSEINIPALDSFNTRSEYNAWKRQTASFLDRGNWKYQFKKNKNGVSKSVKEIKQLQKETKLAQQKAKKKLKEISKYPFVAGGNQYGTVGDRINQMKNTNELGIYVPPDFNFDVIQNNKQFDMKRKQIEKKLNPDEITKTMEVMKNNFMTVLEHSFNSDAQELIEKIKDVPADDFLEMYYMFEEFDFALYRSPKDQIMHNETTEEEHMADVNQMMIYIEKYEKGILNFDMKGFDR